MLISTIVVGVMAVVLFCIGYFKGEGQHITSVKFALSMIVKMLPLLFFAFIIAGMIQFLIPKGFLSKWLGEESGIRGILVGTVAGGMAIGGPYVCLPVMAGFLRAGAGIGTMVAFWTGWALWGFGRLPLELGILGWKFTLIRFLSVFFFPPIAGILAQTFFGHVK
ncbi:permease [Chlamydiota bacterium]